MLARATPTGSKSVDGLQLTAGMTLRSAQYIYHNGTVVTDGDQGGVCRDRGVQGGPGCFVHVAGAGVRDRLVSRDKR